MPNTADLDTLLRLREQLRSEVTRVGDMRPGSLVPRFRRCGKPSCHCAKKGEKGHGPSYSLTHAVGGKTVTRVIPAGTAVDRTREQLQEYHRFRQLVQKLVMVSEQICDLQLRATELAPSDVKENSSRGSSRR